MNVPAKRELAAQLALRHPSELEARCLAAKVPGFLMVHRVPTMPPETGEARRPAARATGFPVDDPFPPTWWWAMGMAAKVPGVLLHRF